MKGWYSPLELAQLGLPGIPGSKRRITDKANREKWKSRPRSGRGGGREYAFESLPLDAQDALIKRATTNTPTEHPLAAPLAATPAGAPSSPATLPSAGCQPAAGVFSTPTERALVAALPHEDLPQLTDRQIAARDAAALVARYIGSLMTASRLSAHAVADRLAAGPDALPATIAEAVRAAQTKPRGWPSARWFERLHSLYIRGEVEGDPLRYLTPGVRHDAPAIHGRNAWWVAPLLRHWCTPSGPRLTEAWDNARADLLAAGTAESALPSYSTVCRTLDRLPVTLRYRGRMSGSALRQFLPFVRRDDSALMAHDVWVGDGHSFKARVAHPIHGQPFVPEITFVIDWKTTLICGWSVALSESTVAVSDALRHGMATTRARPLIYYSDNGSGHTARQIDHPIVGLCARLGIHHETGRPGNPMGRGIIEGLWDHTLIRLAKTYPTAQTSSTDRDHIRKVGREIDKALRTGQPSRLLPTWQQLLDDIAACVEDHNTRHQPEKLGGLTPIEAVAKFAAPYALMAAPTDAELDSMFRPEEIRTAPRGEVQLFNRRYFARELVSQLAEGERVRVAYDIHDASTVLVKRMDGRALCRAVLGGNTEPVFQRPLVDDLRERRVEGAVKRLERKRQTALAELNDVVDGRELFRQRARVPVAAELDEETRAAAAAELAAIEDARRRREHPAEDPGVAEIPARPTFGSDFELWLWVRDHPESATERDRAYLAERLEEDDVLRMQVSLEERRAARA